MVEFVYDITKNASIEYMSFQINCRYHLRISYKKNFDYYSKSKAANKLIKKLWNIITICKKNL